MRKSNSRIKVKPLERQRLILSSKKKTTQLKKNPNDQKLKTRYNPLESEPFKEKKKMTYENFYKAVMDDKNIEESLMKDMKDDINLMIESNDTFNNFIVLYNYLNTLNDTNNFFDFRVNNKDFKDDNGVLNKKAINFNSTSLKRNISNKEMINRFIIDNYIINLKTENGLKIGTESNKLYNNVYNYIEEQNLLEDINNLIKKFTSKEYSNLIEKINNSEYFPDLANIYNKIPYEFLLIKKLSEHNIGYYIINIILINKILDEIDFFEFMMLQRILVIFNKYDNVTLNTDTNVSETITIAETTNTEIIKDKFFIYFTVISLYKKLFKSEFKDEFKDKLNLYKLAYESYYIKSLLINTSSGKNNLDNRVKYYNFMFEDHIAVGKSSGTTIHASESNKNLADNQEQYNKGLLHYLNIAAVCLLKDSKIKILYDTTLIKPSQIINNDNQLIEKLNILTKTYNEANISKLSDQFLKFIINEFFSKKNITINNAGIFEIQLSNTSL